jgi:hypothetical protein
MQQDLSGTVLHSAYREWDHSEEEIRRLQSIILRQRNEFEAGRKEMEKQLEQKYLIEMEQFKDNVN